SIMMPNMGGVQRQLLGQFELTAEYVFLARVFLNNNIPNVSFIYVQKRCSQPFEVTFAFNYPKSLRLQSLLTYILIS
ncbi:hypothetical protein ACJX0J_034849, partial [Zea mays]